MSQGTQDWTTYQRMMAGQLFDAVNARAMRDGYQVVPERNRNLFIDTVAEHLSTQEVESTVKAMTGETEVRDAVAHHILTNIHQELGRLVARTPVDPQDDPVVTQLTAIRRLLETKDLTVNITLGDSVISDQVLAEVLRKNGVAKIEVNMPVGHSQDLQDAVLEATIGGLRESLARNPAGRRIPVNRQRQTSADDADTE